MPYLKNEELFKVIIAHAVQDRMAFLDAVSNNDLAAEQTRLEIKRIQALTGSTVKSALTEEKETFRLACLYAEFWNSSLADAFGTGKEANEALAMHRKVHDFRMRLFGKTTLESLQETAPSTPFPATMNPS